MEFAAEFRVAYNKLRSDPARPMNCVLMRGPQLYAVRFSGIRRLNFGRFPYGIFYTVYQNEIRVLAVLHGSRETRKILAERRRTFFSNPL
jgi:plasmid stabilization system protein ParE